MKYPAYCFLILFLAINLYSIPQDDHVEQQVDRIFVSFDQHPVGKYNQDQLVADFIKIKGSSHLDRVEVVPSENESNGKEIRLFYPKNSIGPLEGGAQWVQPLKPKLSYTLSYRLKFEVGFDFTKGGKLPGLTSGGWTYTGGNKPVNGEGWSARYMWRAEGELVVYLYYMEMKGKWGDDLSLGVYAIPGRWYHLKQKITVNSSLQSDGRIEVWVDDQKCLDRRNLHLRQAPMGLVNAFYFSTFHGGNTPDFSPKHDCFIRFDDFLIE